MSQSPSETLPTLTNTTQASPFVNDGHDHKGEFMDLGTDLNFYVEREKSMLEKMQSSSLFAEETIKSADYATNEAKHKLKPYWINSEPLFAGYVNAKGEASLFQLSDLYKNKVILFNFWNMTSPQSVLSLEKTKNILNRYQNAGLEVVGVHTSAFDFAARPEILADFVYHEALTYPVVNDEDFAIWRAFQARYWPTRILVSPTFEVIYRQVGDEGFDTLEKEIQDALRKQFPGLPCPRVAEEESRPVDLNKTKDIYFLYPQADDSLMQKFTEADYEHIFPAHSILKQDGSVSFMGPWKASNTGISLSSEAYSKNKFSGPSSIKLRFKASSVFLVGGSKNYAQGGLAAQTLIEVLLDGRPLRSENRGTSCKIGSGKRTVLELNAPKLHQLVSGLEVNTSHELELTMEPAYADNLELMALIFSSR